MNGLIEERIGDVHIVHRSIVPLLCRLFFVQIITIVISFILFELVYLILNLAAYTLLLFLFLIVILASTSFSVFVCLDWLNDYYLLEPKRLIKISGIFSKHEEINVAQNIETVEVRQGFWGRLFNYGDIIINKLGQKIELSSVPNPEHFYIVLSQLKTVPSTLPNTPKDQELIF